jgi:hypothetical protein
MSLLTLTTPGFIRLQAQVALNGTFTHTLSNAERISVIAQVTIEQCKQAIDVRVRIGNTANSLQLPKHRTDNGNRVARFIQQIANGRSNADEFPLASELERTLRQALRKGHGTYYLPADELEPTLLIRRNRSGGHTAQINLHGAACMLTLPADTQRAHAMLVDNLRRFLTGYRDSLAAAA